MKNSTDDFPYADIIDLARPVSKHLPMSLSARAAQFAPYATLTGHRDIVSQDEQTAAHKIDLDDAVDFIPDTEYVEPENYLDS